MLKAVLRALALIDALLLLYLATTYDWFNFDVSLPTESIASLFLGPMLWALVIGERLFFAAYFALVGAGVWRSLKGTADKPSWVGRLSTPILLLALAGIALAWFSTGTGVLHSPPGYLNDRLTLFDSLAQRANNFGDLWGTTHYAEGSIGRYLVILLGAGYLAEKYLLAGWNVPWPLPLLPIAAVTWVAVVTSNGERDLRDYVTARQWRLVSVEQPWLDAVAACEALGPGWRLPRREELSRYLGSPPSPLASPTGGAWTNTAADSGARAIAVDLAPRFSGRWNRGSELLRDESLCEYRDQPGYASDWFTQLRPRVCAATTHSPALFTPGVRVNALIAGTGIRYSTAATLCLSAAEQEAAIPVRQRRGYPQAQEFTRVADFSAFMAGRCSADANIDRVSCFAFAPDLPPFEETGDERTMRAFCDLLHNGEGCDRYAALMDARQATERATTYRQRGCTRGYPPSCEPTLEP